MLNFVVVVVVVVVVAIYSYSRGVPRYHVSTSMAVTSHLYTSANYAYTVVVVVVVTYSV